MPRLEATRASGYAEVRTLRPGAAALPVIPSGVGTAPAFAIALLTVAGCGVFIATTVVFYTARTREASDALRRKIDSLVAVARLEYGPDRRQEVGACRSRFCKWNRDYIVRAIDMSKDPCDDFYAHACDTRRWFQTGNASTLPFADLSTSQLITDLEKFFRYFSQLKGKLVGPGDNFLGRMMWVFEACQKEADVKRNISDELGDVLDILGLPRALPVSNVTRGSIVHLVAVGDRHLRLHPLFKVHVLRRGVLKLPRGFEIVLSAPETLYRRFLTNFVQSTDSVYGDFVARTLSLCFTADTHTAARRVVQLEKRLESFKLASEEELMMEPRENRVSLDALFLSDDWDWLTYFNSLIPSANGTISKDSGVLVSDVIFFRRLGYVLGGGWDAVIANYIVFRTIVELAPALGSEADYLLKLTHDYDVPGFQERKAACLILLERLFKYGVAITAKLTLGKEFATTKRSHMDRQMTSLFKASKRLIESLVESGKSWVGPSDKETVSQKLRTMRFEFGAQCNLVEYETYRQAAEVPSRPYFSRSRIASGSGGGWVNLRLDDEHPLSRIVLHMYSTASRAYWDSWASPTSRAYDNRYAATEFRPGYELQHSTNLLAVPYATVAFLSELNAVIHPVLYGVVTIHLVRGILEALTKSGSSLNADLRPSEWWSVGTLEAYETASACLESQYPPLLAEGTLIRSLEDNFLDNAVVYPLFRLYRNALARSAGEVGNATLFDVSHLYPSLTMDQMFFYNLAAAHCDFRDEPLRREQRRFHQTPAPWRLNVPLRNLPAFAEAFSCARGSFMNPSKRCSMWERQQPFDTA
ncbi:neprilysin-2-like [Haemaphysalis longicornis]